MCLPLQEEQAVPFYRVIRFLRSLSGLTQDQMGAKLGLSRHYSRWEQGLSKPSYDSFRLLENNLGVKHVLIDMLLKGQIEMIPGISFGDFNKMLVDKGLSELQIDSILLEANSFEVEEDHCES